MTRTEIYRMQREIGTVATIANCTSREEKIIACQIAIEDDRANHGAPEFKNQTRN